MHQLMFMLKILKYVEVGLSHIKQRNRLKILINENNQHSDIWLTESKETKNKFPDYGESDYELLNDHRGIWGNYPTEND